MARPVFGIRKVALKVKEQTTLPLIANATHYADMMTGNAYFPNPFVPLTQIRQKISDLDQARANAESRIIGLAEITRAKRKALEIDLKFLATYVETIANQDPDYAVSVIESSGMPIKRPMSRRAKVFSVTQGKVSGSVVINDKAVNRGVYTYQVTETPYIPSSWETVYIGMQVKFKLADLPPGEYYFRAGIDARHRVGWFGEAIRLYVN